MAAQSFEDGNTAGLGNSKGLYIPGLTSSCRVALMVAETKAETWLDSKGKLADGKQVYEHPRPSRLTRQEIQDQELLCFAIKESQVGPSDWVVRHGSQV